MSNDILEIKKANVLKAYADGCPDVKKVFENIFGNEHFKPRDITDIVKDYESACIFKGLNHAEELPYPTPKNERQIALNGWAMADIIVSALNTDPITMQEWIPNYSNNNEEKWWAVMIWNGSSGFGFSGACRDCTATHANVGARLSLRTASLAEYFGKNFNKVHNMYLTKTKPANH